MDYRKLYADTFGDIKSGFDIHHINFDREDNRLENLVAVPKELHKEYHKIINNIDVDGNYFLPNLMTNGYNNDELIKKIVDLDKILKKFNYYLDVKKSYFGGV